MAFTLLTSLRSVFSRSSERNEPRSSDPSPLAQRFRIARLVFTRDKDQAPAEVIGILEGPFIKEQLPSDYELALPVGWFRRPSLLLQGLIEGTSELKALYKKLGYTAYYDFKAILTVKELKSLMQDKRPTDLKRFLDLLDELEAIYRGQEFDREFGLKPEPPVPLVRHSGDKCEWVLGKIAQVREDAKSENGDVAESLYANSFGSLETEVEYVANLKYDKGAEEKKQALDSLLEELIDLRLRRSEEWWLDFKDRSVELAKKYLDTGWMHSQWLTSFVLTNLVDADLAPLFPSDWWFPKMTSFSAKRRYHEQNAKWVMPSNPSVRRVLQWVVVGPIVIGLGLLSIAVISAYVRQAGTPENASSANFWGLALTGLVMAFSPGIIMGIFYECRYRIKGLRSLYALREEVASGVWDGEEIARRLREYEKKNIYVHSLTYALLRSQSSSPAGQ